MSMIRKGRVRWVAKGDVLRKRGSSLNSSLSLPNFSLTFTTELRFSSVGSKLRNETLLAVLWQQPGELVKSRRWGLALMGAGPRVRLSLRKGAWGVSTPQTSAGNRGKWGTQSLWPGHRFQSSYF